MDLGMLARGAELGRGGQLRRQCHRFLSAHEAVACPDSPRAGSTQLYLGKEGAQKVVAVRACVRRLTDSLAGGRSQRRLLPPVPILARWPLPPPPTPGATKVFRAWGPLH
eukprot:1493034-Alexandrium_andersonii.AAC.1